MNSTTTCPAEPGVEKTMEDKTMLSLKYTTILTLSILLAIGALGCGGGKNPVNNDPHNQKDRKSVV